MVSGFTTVKTFVLHLIIIHSIIIVIVNDNAPIFEKPIYEFILSSNLRNFTIPAFVKATDADAEEPNNVIRYEIISGNYENKFRLDKYTGKTAPIKLQ